MQDDSSHGTPITATLESTPALSSREDAASPEEEAGRGEDDLHDVPLQLSKPLSSVDIPSYFVVNPEVAHGPKSPLARLLESLPHSPHGLWKPEALVKQIERVTAGRVATLRAIERHVAQNTNGCLSTASTIVSMKQQIVDLQATTRKNRQLLLDFDRQYVLKMGLRLHALQLRRDRAQSVLQCLEKLLTFSAIREGLPQRRGEKSVERFTHDDERAEIHIILDLLTPFRKNAALCSEFAALKDFQDHVQEKLTTTRRRLQAQLQACISSAAVNPLGVERPNFGGATIPQNTKEAIGLYAATMRSLSLMPNTDSAGEGLVKQVLETVAMSVQTTILGFLEYPPEPHDSPVISSASPIADSPSLPTTTSGVSRHSRRHRRRESLSSMSAGIPTQMIAVVVAKLFESVAALLLRFDCVTRWHIPLMREDIELQNEKPSVAKSDFERRSFCRFCSGVARSLIASRKALWHQIVKIISEVIVAMPMNASMGFLVEDMLIVVYFVHRFARFGEKFVATYDSLVTHPPGGVPEIPAGVNPSPGDAVKNRYPHCTALLNSLTMAAFQFFQSYHLEALRELQAVLVNDSWQRLPLGRKFQLIKVFPLFPSLTLDPEEYHAAKGGGGKQVPVDAAQRGSGNPFKGWSPQCHWPRNIIRGRSTPNVAMRDEGDDFLSRLEAQLQEARNEEAVSAQDFLKQFEAASSKDGNKNTAVISASTQRVAQFIEVYWQILCFVPTIAFEIFVAIEHILDLYIYAVVFLFTDPGDAAKFMEDHKPPPECCGGRKIYSKHAAFLIQRGRKNLQRLLLKTRAFMRGDVAKPETTAKPSCLDQLSAAMAGFQTTPHPRLRSPGHVYGLAERVVGVESSAALLSSLGAVLLPPAGDLPDDTGREIQEEPVATQFLSVLSDANREHLRRSFTERWKVIFELRDLVYSSAAWDIGDYDRLIQSFSRLRWDEVVDGSPSPAANVIQLKRLEVQELSRRVSCLAGGSIPPATRALLMRKTYENAVQACVEILSRIRPPPSKHSIWSSKGTADSQSPGPWLFMLVEDFTTLLEMYQEAKDNVLPQSNSGESISADTPPTENTENDRKDIVHRLKLRRPITVDLLHQFVNAHSFSGTDLLAWCKQQVDYNVRLLVSIVQKLESMPFSQRTLLIEEIEMWFTEVLTIV